MVVAEIVPFAHSLQRGESVSVMEAHRSEEIPVAKTVAFAVLAFPPLERFALTAILVC
eukprot:COSAG02_NODE_15693_length_1148_cov_1.198284_2_plen_58_part_00